MYYDPKCYKLGYKKKEYVELDQDKDIDELNKLTSCNSGGLLYYRHGTISCQEFVALSKVRRKIIPKPIEWVVRDLYPGKSILEVRYPSMFCNFLCPLLRSYLYIKHFDQKILTAENICVVIQWSIQERRTMAWFRLYGLPSLD